MKNAARNKSLKARKGFAVMFRFLNGNEKPTKWHGFAFADTVEELFWKIDEHGDPNMCEIMAADCFSLCFETKKDKDGAHVHEVMNKKTELADAAWGAINFGDWVKPVWPSNPYK